MLEKVNGLNQTFNERLLERNQNSLMKSMQKLSSGLKINNAGDDAAGLSVLTKITAQVSGEQQAAYNVQDSYSVAQVAEGGLSAVNDIQQRLRQLAVQSSNGTLTDADRSLLQTEADQLVSELDRMSGNIEFNGQKILDGSYAAGSDEFTTQAGANNGESIDVNFSGIDSTSLGLDNFNISTQSAAELAIQKVDDSIGNVSTQRAQLGAYQNRLEKAYEFIGIQRENQMNAESVIADTDYASEMTTKTSAELISNISLAILAQGNLLNKNVLALIQ